MRKVFFKKYIPAIYEQGGGTKIAGTGCWDIDFIHPGWFHQWAPYQDGQEVSTMGIIELEDGTVTEAMPSNIKFVEPYQEVNINHKIRDRYKLINDQQYKLQALRSIGDFGNYNFERWTAFNKVQALELQEEMVRACSMFTVEPIIVTNHQILFLQKGSQTIVQFNGVDGRFSIYGSCAMITQDVSVRHIFETYFKLL